jgi:hypothetical protein
LPRSLLTQLFPEQHPVGDLDEVSILISSCPHTFAVRYCKK